MKTNSLKTTARVAGFLYLTQIPLGVFGIVYVPEILAVSGDMSATVSNILQHEFVFRLSIISTILCALMTILTAYYIYKVLKPVDGFYAKWIVIFTMLVAPITIVNELSHLAILILIKSEEMKSVFSQGQIHCIASILLDIHKQGIHIVGIFFGLWLLPMGYLVIKSNYIPKIIDYLLLATCLGYLVDFPFF